MNINRLTELLRELAYILFATAVIILFQLPLNPLQLIYDLTHPAPITAQIYIDRMWIP